MLTSTPSKYDRDEPKRVAESATGGRLVIIVLLSLWGSLGPAIVLSFVAAECLIFFFTPPIFSFEIDRPEDVVTVAAFLTISLRITGFVMRTRSLAEAAALKDRL